MANEKRLIDANVLEHLGYTDITKFLGGFVEKILPLSEAPTVDAVEVVRCKDCSYWDKAKSNKKGFLICPASGMEITEHDFCSYRERRTDETKAD